MILNEMAKNREEFDKAAGTIRERIRDRFLRLIGPRTPGLLVWHFGAGGELRSPNEIPVEKIQEYAHKYA